MDELKNRIERGRAGENKKTKKSRKSKKGLTLKQRREEEKHLRNMHKRGQEVTGELELMMELKKEDSASPLYNHSPYVASNTEEEYNKRLSNSRKFNELKELELMRRFQEETVSPLPSPSDSPLYTFSDSPLRTPSEYERLTAVYPEQVYGKEAEKIWNEKFGYKPNAPRRPQPSVRKTKKNAPRTNAPRRPQPSVRKTNVPRTNAPRRPQPVTRKVTQAAPVVQAAPKMKSKPVPRGNRRRKQTG